MQRVSPSQDMHASPIMAPDGHRRIGRSDHRRLNQHPEHPIRILEGTALEAILGVRELLVNSTHHQAVRDPGRAGR